MAIVNKKHYSYTLSFSDVLKELFENNSKYWYQGENFQDGVVFLKEDGDLKERIFPCGCGFGWSQFIPIITQGVYAQKYRRVSTQPDAERRV